MHVALASSALVATLISGAIAAPTLEGRASRCFVNPANASPPAKCNSADPAYTQTEVLMFNNIVCPTTTGGTLAVKKPYLLVPGTGNNGSQSWQNTYVKLLGKSGGAGYDVCYVAEPEQMLNDATLADERIAYAINALYSISGVKPIVQGWSQGNLDIQWVLTFWTSSRSNTDRFISLAGDFRGTTLISILNGFGLVLNGTNLRERSLEPASIGAAALDHELRKRIVGIPLPQSVYQQLVGANYLQALQKHGGLNGQVPTTSIYSNTDEIISPEDNTPTATSYLTSTSAGPVGNILIQNTCPGLEVSHGDELFINYSYQVVKLAIASSNKYASPADVAAANIPCNNAATAGLDPQTGNEAIITAGAAIIAWDLELRGTIIEPAVPAYAQ